MREWKRGQRVGVERGQEDGGMEARAAPTGLDFIWKESGPRRSSHMSSSSSELASYRQPW